MKVILISPFLDCRSFGLRVLSTCLKREGCHVKLLFLPKRFVERYDDKELNQIVELSKDAELIGISVTTNHFNNAAQISQTLKRNIGNTLLWGGIHATIRPSECLEYADIVCIGEGEGTVVELIRKMKGGHGFQSVQGIWFKHNGVITKGKLRPLLHDLNSIPFPDYDYETHYILIDGCIRKMDEDLLQEVMGGVYETFTTRGCPYGCTYCCNNTLNKMYPMKKRVRERSVNNVIEELKTAKRKMPFIQQVNLNDDAFFIRRTEEIRDFAIKYKLHIGLPLYVYGGHPSSLTRENLSTLVDAGLRFIRMGIQTGSERTKREYKRYYSNERVIKSAVIINEFKGKVRAGYDVILDNPWDNEEDLIETLVLLSKLPVPYDLDIFSLVLYPETELYEKAKKDGIIRDEQREIYSRDFHDCKGAYLNELFFLLKEYASNGHRIPPNMMSFLTNGKLRGLKISYLLYQALKFRLDLPANMQRFKDLVYQGLKDIREGNWSRITRYIEKHVSR